MTLCLAHPAPRCPSCLMSLKLRLDEDLDSMCMIFRPLEISQYQASVVLYVLICSKEKHEQKCLVSSLNLFEYSRDNSFLVELRKRRD